MLEIIHFELIYFRFHSVGNCQSLAIAMHGADSKIDLQRTQTKTILCSSLELNVFQNCNLAAVLPNWMSMRINKPLNYNRTNGIRMVLSHQINSCQSASLSMRVMCAFCLAYQICIEKHGPAHLFTILQARLESMHEYQVVVCVFVSVWYGILNIAVHIFSSVDKKLSISFPLCLFYMEATAPRRRRRQTNKKNPKKC